MAESNTSALKKAGAVGIAQTSGKCDSKITEGNMRHLTAIWALEEKKELKGISVAVPMLSLTVEFIGFNSCIFQLLM